MVSARVLARIGAGLDELLSRRVFDSVIRLPLRARDRGEGLQPLRDLDQVSGFLAGGGPAALLDLPWMPLYVALCFAFHPWLGVAATHGRAAAFDADDLTDRLMRGPTRVMTGFTMKRNALAQSGVRNAEVLAAMGMGANLADAGEMPMQAIVPRRSVRATWQAEFGALSRVLRMMLQSAVLAIGAYLVIYQEATPGIIIASSILTSRALAPVELAIAHWKGLLNTRQSWRRLSELLTAFPVSADGLELPPPVAELSVESISVVPPGERRLVVQDVQFSLQAGACAGIIGPSGSGKSSLARVARRGLAFRARKNPP